MLHDMSWSILFDKTYIFCIFRRHRCCLPHNKFLASIELLGRKVLPKSATGLNGNEGPAAREGVSGHAGGNRASLNGAGTFEGEQEAGPSILERR